MRVHMSVCYIRLLLSTLGHSTPSIFFQINAAAPVAAAAFASAIIDIARRAKRLRKLLRLLQAEKAQEARNRFKTQTWLLLLIMVAAHVGCFVLFTSETTRQHG